MCEIRVLHFIPGYVRRGAEFHVLNLVYDLIKQGIHVSLALFWDNEVAKEARKLGINVHVIKKRFRGDPLTVLNLAKLIHKEQYNIIHTHLINGHFYGRIAARLARKCRVVSTVHGYREALSTPHEWEKSLFYRQDILMGRLSDKVISVTEGLRKQLINDGIPEEKVIKVPSYINIDTFDPDKADREKARKQLGISDKEFLVGTVGGLVRGKRLDMFLQMASKIIQKGFPMRFLIVGEGHMASELQKIAKILRIDDRVIFAGWCPDLPHMISAMDAFALCSETETTSVVIVEAMAMRKPIVAMAVGDLQETFTEGVSINFVPFGDIQGMIKTLDQLHKDPEKCRKMGEAGRKEATEKFSKKEVANKHIQIYRELLRA